MTKAQKFQFATFVAAALLPLQALHAAETAPSREITVFKTPWCGCCQEWVEAIEAAGYSVKSTDIDDLAPIKKQAGVPKELEACHTAAIGNERKYVIEGHVPLEALDKLLSEQPDIRGIATPGMPMGSLGMGDDPDVVYDVFAFTGKTGEAAQVFFKAGGR
jgi:hypothetical protein